ncbi:MAG: glycosyltransferase family 2 protein [Patescibacteria group bacterium]
MKISIITVSYNSAKTIEDTIQSVLSQKDADVEYLVIDGGSKDATMEIVKKYQERISVIVSEPDKGIYDAMNKGIQRSKGDVIGILNSDDFYANDHVLADGVKLFTEKPVDAVYGDIVYVDREDTKRQVRYWKAGTYQEKKLRSGWIMPHPAFFVRKEMYDRFGLFRLDFPIAADYELMLRFLKKKISVEYIPKTLVCMREGGNSASGLKTRLNGWRELRMAWRVNGESVPFLFITQRVLGKISQFLQS